MVHSKFKITKVQCANKYFFPDHTSAIVQLYGCGMAEFCITEYLGFIYKKKHTSYQCFFVGDRSVAIHNDNLEIPATDNVMTPKASPQKYLIIFASRGPL